MIGVDGQGQSGHTTLHMGTCLRFGSHRGYADAINTASTFPRASPFVANAPVHAAKLPYRLRQTSCIVERGIKQGETVRVRRLLSLSVVLALPTSRIVTAQQRIVPDSAAGRYVAQTITVEGIVASVGSSRRSATTFLNFGAAYPNQSFTAVIFRSSASRFPNPQQWEGRRVRVSGKVRLYREKPEIVLEEPSQIVVVP